MIVIVDTSVWSLVLRRKRAPQDNPSFLAFGEHVERGDGLMLLGEILQEVPATFLRLEREMAPFPLLELDRGTYVSAARLTNRCHRTGFQPGAVDALIATACIEYDFPLLTADAHFLEIAKRCQLVVLPPLGRA
jgi:predicted nucleic acid-binding protein